MNILVVELNEIENLEGDEMQNVSGVMTLTIKKKFYDQIKSGEKRIEYRTLTRSLYDRLQRAEIIHFHYFKKNYLVCEIGKVVIIKNELNSEWVKGDFCLAISIKFLRERMRK